MLKFRKSLHVESRHIGNCRRGPRRPTALHKNTYLVLKGARESILIDCGGNPIGRLQRAGVSPDTLSAVILTHDHPDHIYGLPSLLMDLWLFGHTDPLKIYAPASTLKTIRAIMAAHQWAQWPARRRSKN